MSANPRLFLAAVLPWLWGSTALGQSAIEKYGEPINPIPNVVAFDCGVESSSNMESVRALGTRMRVPKNFESPDGEEAWLYWNVLLKSDDGEVFEAPFARLHVGTYEADSVSSFLGEFEVIAGPETNHLSATVISRLPKPTDFSGEYWLFFLKGTSFLKIVSYDPVDWPTLLACFDQ